MKLEDLVVEYRVFPPLADRSMRNIICVSLEQRQDDGAPYWVVTDGLGSCYCVDSSEWLEKNEGTRFTLPTSALSVAIAAVEEECFRFEEETEDENGGWEPNMLNYRRQLVASARMYLTQVRSICVALAIGGLR